VQSDAVPCDGRLRLSVGVDARDYGVGYQAGSLGGIVRRQGEVEPWYLLGCNHVLYLNGGVFLGGRPPLVTTPSPLFGPGHLIGVVREMPAFCRLAGGSAKNAGDYAIAEVTDHARLLSALPSRCRVRPIAAEKAVGMRVWKAGAATGVTAGRVLDARYEFSLHYPAMNARFGFENQVLIASEVPGVPFSEGGDSGALVVTENGDAVAIVCARSGADTVASPLLPLFDALGLEFVPADPTTFPSAT
jgi:hypothetical protein